MAEAANSFIERKERELLDKPITAKDIGRKGRQIWRRDAVTLRAQSNHSKEVFMVERMTLEHVEGTQLRQEEAREGDVEYRLGYYVVSRGDKWWWGQFAPFVPEEDFWPLIQQAQHEKTIRPSRS